MWACYFYQLVVSRHIVQFVDSPQVLKVSTP